MAVGGYGRGELAPHSDLDVVLVHDVERDPTRVAEQVWYPLWDAGAAIDHAVRGIGEVTEAAARDVRVALGMLDVRHLSGDPSLTLRLRSAVLTQWRRDARLRLPELREQTRARAERAGELAQASVPDLKDSLGGLRDAAVLNALVASWLVDVPHSDLERSRRRLLDVRDALHEVAGRATDRVAPELWPDLAAALDLPDADTAQAQVRRLGRRLAHISRLTWRRVDAVLARPAGVRRRAPVLQGVADGVAVSEGEVVLDRFADPVRDPLLLLRAAAEAAERDLVLAPTTAARLAREGAPLPVPWGAAARGLLTRLLAAGPGLRAVWETLDETGALDRLLPEWERVRLLPHASEVHRFTVDRHLVETCVEASGLIRRVARPDLLLLGCLLHDIGKGGVQEHGAAGEPVAREVAARLGLGPREVDVVGSLVRHHLLLASAATTRDLDDPATVAHVAEVVGDLETLDLLAVLTEADARATSAKVWSTWRASLVTALVTRLRSTLAGRGAPPETSGADGQAEVDLPEGLAGVVVRVEPADTGARVTVVGPDQVGLLAAVAGVLALQRVSVRQARAWTQGEYAVSVWEVDAPDPDPAVLRQRLELVLEGRVDPRTRLAQGRGDHDPAVEVRHDASEQATVLEVRTSDRRGVVHLVCAALADLKLSVRSAHLTTLGPQAVDVFYVQEVGAGVLGDDRSAAAAHAVRRALSGS